MSGNEIWQMCPKYYECSNIGSREAELITEEKNEAYSCPSSFLTTNQLSTVSTVPEISGSHFVYSRRKLRGNINAVFSAQAAASTKRSGEDCVSVVSCCAPSLKEQHVVFQGNAFEDSRMPYTAHKGEAHVLKLESINGCLLVEERVSDQASKNIGQKIIEVDSINDSCSSSKSDLEIGSAAMYTEVDDTSECSSSSAMVVEILGEELLEKDLCVSVIRSQNVLESVWPSKTHGSKGVGDNSASCNSRFCKICAHPESPLKMLICDNCEEAFHLSCCNPHVKKIPQDEWFCHSCSKKRRIILTETISRRFPNIIGDKGRYGNYSTGESNPIALMLRDTGSYATGVRIGKGFQAEVPDWSGPITNNVDRTGEAMEMDPSAFVNPSSNAFKFCKPHKLSSIGNWLQCREVIDGAGENAGTICGKWRRSGCVQSTESFAPSNLLFYPPNTTINMAPLFEVQSDDWECFCSVLWDPIQADCAVPQELNTEEVLKQLKYIQMLRPRLIARRRKLECINNDDDSADNVENVRNMRTQEMSTAK